MHLSIMKKKQDAGHTKPESSKSAIECRKMEFDALYNDAAEILDISSIHTTDAQFKQELGPVLKKIEKLKAERDKLDHDGFWKKVAFMIYPSSTVKKMSRLEYEMKKSSEIAWGKSEKLLQGGNYSAVISFLFTDETRAKGEGPILHKAEKRVDTGGCIYVLAPQSGRESITKCFKTGAITSAGEILKGLRMLQDKETTKLRAESVAVKTVQDGWFSDPQDPRTYQQYDRAEREADIWTIVNACKHPNVLPFLGVYKRADNLQEEGTGDKHGKAGSPSDYATTLDNRKGKAINDVPWRADASEAEATALLDGELNGLSDLDLTDKEENEQDAAGRNEPVPEMLYLVSPWASEGDINSFLRGFESKYRDNYVLKLVRDVILGLEYLHSTSSGKPPVYHGDLHPRNVLVHWSEKPATQPEKSGTSNEQNMPVAWIADFGLSAGGHRKEAPTGVTHEDYRAPELAGWKVDDRPIRQLSMEERYARRNERESRFGKMEKADVYSFGKTAYTMLTRQKGHPSKWSLLGEKSEQWNRVMVLLAECCDEDPQKRPTMTQVRQKWEESDFERDLATAVK